MREFKKYFCVIISKSEIDSLFFISKMSKTLLISWNSVKHNRQKVPHIESIRVVPEAEQYERIKWDRITVFDPNDDEDGGTRSMTVAPEVSEVWILVVEEIGGPSSLSYHHEIGLYIAPLKSGLLETAQDIFDRECIVQSQIKRENKIDEMLSDLARTGEAMIEPTRFDSLYLNLYRYTL